MDELLGRRMPHSVEAEQAILGSMLIDPACIPAVIERLRRDDFYIEANRDIYETILTMFSFSQTIDPVTVLDQMRVRGVFVENRSQAYILELMQVTPTSANVREYVSIVRDQALLRRLVQVSGEISEMVYAGEGGAELLLEAAEQKIYALRQGRSTGGLIPIGMIVAQVYEQLNELAEREESIPGLSTGLVDLDSAILGLNRGDLILIASRPGMGKTSVAMNIAMHVGMKTKKQVAIFSLEMSREQLAVRLLSGASGVDGKVLLTGRLNQTQWRRLAVAVDELSETNLLIDDNPTLTVADMNAQCRRLKDLGLVVVDYLQLMQSAGNGKNSNYENRQQAVSDMSRMLKIMAKELNVPVLCLSQLSRAGELRSGGSRLPQLSDLRESGAIEQDADVVIALYREGSFNKECENPNLAQALVLKNRHGDTGSVDLLWRPEITSFQSVERRHGDRPE